MGGKQVPVMVLGRRLWCVIAPVGVILWSAGPSPFMVTVVDA